MKKAASLLFVLTILSTFIGFARDMILAFYYGASEITDIYLVSTTIPQTLSAFIGAAISSIYIPLYKKIENNKSLLESNMFTNNIINILFFINALIVGIVFLFTPVFIKIFASGFDEAVMGLAIIFTRISILSIFFSTTIILFSNYLQIKNKFLATGLASIPLNFIIIISIWYSVRTEEIYLAIGFVIASIVQVLFFLPFLRKAKFKYKFFFNLKDKNIAEFIKLSLPVMLGVSVYQLNVIVDKTIASQVMIGGISLVMYANKVIALIYGVFAVPIATVIYPTLSKMGVQEDYERMKTLVLKSLTSILILIIPAVIAILIYSDTIIKVIYGRGAFDSTSIIIASSILFYYSIGLIGTSIREITYRIYYSLQDTKTPLYNAAIAMIINIILSLILSKFIGLAGIALGTSLSAIICSILLLNGLKKKIGLSFNKKFYVEVLKIIISSLVMGVVSWLFFVGMVEVLNIYLAFSSTVVVAIVVYIFSAYITKIDEAKNIYDSIRGKLFKNQ